MNQLSELELSAKGRSQSEIKQEKVDNNNCEDPEKSKDLKAKNLKAKEQQEAKNHKAKEQDLVAAAAVQQLNHYARGLIMVQK